MGALNRLHMGEMSELAHRTATLEQLLIEQARINTELLRLVKDGSEASQVTTSNGTTTTTTTDPTSGDFVYMTEEQVDSVNEYLTAVETAQQTYEAQLETYNRDVLTYSKKYGLFKFMKDLETAYSQVGGDHQDGESFGYGGKWNISANQRIAEFTDSEYDNVVTARSIIFEESDGHWVNTTQQSYDISINNGEYDEEYSIAIKGTDDGSYEWSDDSSAALSELSGLKAPVEPTLTSPSMSDYGVTEDMVAAVRSGKYTTEAQKTQEVIDTAAQGRVVINLTPGSLHPFHGHPHMPPPPPHHHHPHPMPMFPPPPPPFPYLDYVRYPAPPPMPMFPYPYTRAYWTYRW